MNPKKFTLDVASNQGANQNKLHSNYTSNPIHRRKLIERIKSEADYNQLYQSEIRHSEAGPDFEGWMAGGNCPLSTDCQGNKFQVNLQTGRCRCRSCKSETDALGFIMQRQGIPFPDALRLLKGMD